MRSCPAGGAPSGAQERRGDMRADVGEGGAAAVVVTRGTLQIALTNHPVPLSTATLCINSTDPPVVTPYTCVVGV
ncbi:hypothetical protein AALO_G00200400 [Alosa alosa]|uniref:Uncharacterized protein n=1 Tax=Alosa alosa TaxID=278164 RepID=A0AAV6G736_9TELE|nr:hypothetical protein AALO_G00200400 [Alosa alosa]